MPAGRAAGSVLIAPETDLGFALNHLKSPYISSHQAVPLQQLNDLYGGGDGLRRAALVIQLRPRRSSSTAAAAAAARSQRRRHCARVPGCGRVVQRVAAQVVARRHVRTYQPQSPPSNNPINNPFSPLKQPFSPSAPIIWAASCASFLLPFSWGCELQPPRARPVAQINQICLYLYRIPHHPLYTNLSYRIAPRRQHGGTRSSEKRFAQPLIEIQGG
jgi:hypothetical protein